MNVNKFCGACLEECSTLNDLEKIFRIEWNFDKTNINLEIILNVTFGINAQDLAASHLCELCTNIIIKGYLLVQCIRRNKSVLSNQFDYLSARTQCEHEENNAKDKRYININLKGLQTESVTNSNIQSLIDFQNHAGNKDDLEFTKDDNIPLSNVENRADDFSKISDEDKAKTKKKYKCTKCSKDFTGLVAILKHSKDIHFEHIYICKICKRTIPRKKHLKHKQNHQINKKKNIKENHTNTNAADPTDYNNDTELDPLKSRESVKDHIIVKTRQRELNKECALKNEVKSNKETIFACKLCSNKYWSKGPLKSHMKSIHDNSIVDYQCNKCPSSKKHLSHHSNSHSEAENNICHSRKSIFNTKTEHSHHMRIHKYSKAAKNKADLITRMCDVCGKFLTNEKSLKKHKTTHSDEKQCSHCLKHINVSLFKAHLRKHTQTNRPMTKTKTRQLNKCTKCDYTSFFPECLQAHENRFHLKVRPFKCDECGKCFYSKLTLKEHLRSHLALKPEQCELCGNRFGGKKALKLHMRLHTGEKPYPCDICDEKFLSASRRQSHKIHKHLGKTVQCPVCMKMYFTQSDVRIHVRDCHSEQSKLTKKIPRNRSDLSISSAKLSNQN